jgi:hypothetical protein
MLKSMVCFRVLGALGNQKGQEGGGNPGALLIKHLRRWCDSPIKAGQWQVRTAIPATADNQRG